VKVPALKIVMYVLAVMWMSGAAVAAPEFEDAGFIRAKEPVTVSPQALSYLGNHQSTGKVLLWVFFTDKGIFTKQQIANLVASKGVPFSERATARRLKHGIAEVRFSDMPVRAEYVEQVEAIGAKLRWTSKWLNAASFAVKLGELDAIAKLACVARIEPVALMDKPVEPVVGTPIEEMEQQGDARGLSYGSSAGQLTQINVPVCHDSGYAGGGVIISMFDTGFRTDHNAFTQILAQGRLLHKYDFVFNDSVVTNEPNDLYYAWEHGTATWSTCGGENSGIQYGPAYKASFILCKTEDIRSETPVEEDNWVRAMEWVDSLGTDIISSSLGYSAWYAQTQFNGSTCVTTLAADTAAVHGILVCNSAGNSGPGATSITAPADAFGILSTGAVNSSGVITSFSSRGPSADGRIKPEVCAEGSSAYAAYYYSSSMYTYWSGTSFSCPLVAGTAAIVWGAHPSWTNAKVREALMMTADRHTAPDNTYGWGIVNTWAALHYAPFITGDADGDGELTIADAAFVVSYIFSGGAAPDPIQAGDTDCSNDIDVADAVRLVNYVFGQGPAPCLPSSAN
jgi:serine protease AprX